MFSKRHATFFKQLSYRALASSLPIAVCLTGAWLDTVKAEGSRDMYPNGAPGNRGSIVWRTGTAAGFQRRTLLRVFANAGENILVGSSAVGVNNGDIDIFDPGTVTGPVANEVLPGAADFSCVADRANANQGVIETRAEELAGPDSADGTANVAGYEPCIYTAPTTGIYFVAMYGPSGDNSGTSPSSGVESAIASINTSATQNTGISAWDVTVRSSDPSSVLDLEGRLHAFFINKNMGDNGRALHANLYPITVDGYRYEVDMRGIDPFGFRIFGNQLGNLDSDGLSPLYHDVLGSDGDISSPDGGTSSAPPQYPLFFSSLDPAVLPFLPVYDPLTGLQTGTGFPSAPILPVVDSPVFSGDVSGNTSNLGNGGTFSFNSNLAAVYEIVLSRDGIDFDPSSSTNRVLRGVIPTLGAQSIVWDGVDNNGDVFPTGSFDFRVSIHGGEYHFPISDAENNFAGGPTYTLLNAANPLGNTTAFYDHRGYRTVGGFLVEDSDPADGDPFDDALCGIGPPSPPSTDLILGADSSDPNFNAFGQASGGNTNTRCNVNSSFGDTKTVDLWTYLPSSPSAGDVVIIDATAVDYGDAPDTSTGNGAGNYSTLQANNGPVHGTSATLFLGAGVTNDTDGFVDGTDDNGDATDDTDDAFANLADANANSTYTLSSIPVANTTASSATLHAWIDFDQDGEFELGEYESATVASGDTTTSLSWSVPSSAVTFGTYARFRLTTNSLTDDGTTANRDERSLGGASDGEVEDYFVNIVAPPPSVCISPSSSTFNTTPYAVSPPAAPLQGLAPLSFFGGSMLFDVSLSGSATFSGGVQVQNDGVIGDYLFLQPSNAPNYLTTNNEATYVVTFPTPVTNFSMIGSGLNNEDGTTIQASYQGVPIQITAANFSDLDPAMTLLDADGDTESDTVVSSSPLGGVAVDTNLYTVTIPGPIDTVTVVSGKEDNDNGTVTIGLHTFEYCTDGTPVNGIDFGDVPDTYGTTVANNGARHSIVPGIHLGTAPQSESDAVAPLDGSGDGAEEDGIVLVPLTENELSYSIPAANITATGPGTLHAWVDFNFNGMFEPGEYASVGVADGTPVGDLVWNPITVNSSGNTFARFRFTSDSSVDANTPTGLAVNGEVEDYLLAVTPLANDPNVLVVKRITAINRGLADEQLFDSTYINVGTTSDADNAVNWPGDPVSENFGSGTDMVESYIAGITGVDDSTAVSGVTVVPGNTIEYTISFLSDGDVPAQDLLICDRIPANTTFASTAFNGATPAAAGSGTRGIFLSFNGQAVALTNANDGDEIAATGGNNNGIGGYYFPPSIEPGTALGTTINCGGSNTNGAIVVDLSDVPNATGNGTPLNSHGFIRFSAVVD